TLLTASNYVTDNFTTTLSTYTNYLFAEGHDLELLYNNFSNAPVTTVDFTTSPLSAPRQTVVRNGGDIDYQIESIQADYARSFDLTKLEAGAKYTNFRNLSAVFYDDLVEGTYVRNPERSNDFDYKEKNYALYVSLSRKFGDKLSTKAGLRYEHTDLVGVAGDGLSEENRSNYGNLFPTAYLSYRFNEKNRVNVSYSRRINRPSFRMLSPFRWYDNPLTYGTGNPLLAPAINNNFDLSYNFNSRLNVSLYAQLMRNGIGRIVIIEGAEKIVRAENYLDQNSYGISANLNLNPQPWLDTYVAANAAYSTSSSAIPLVAAGSGYSFYYSINNSLSPFKNKQFKILVNFWHQLPAERGNASRRGLSALSLGVCGPIANRLRFNFLFDDIFRQVVSRGQLFFQEYSQFYENYYDSQRINCTLSYSFGNQRAKGNRKSVKFSEKNRGGY
ncbi:MAG: outer membrane beta-barrel family protein, partial [Bacteroidota bacterium]